MSVVASPRVIATLLFDSSMSALPIIASQQRPSVGLFIHQQGTWAGFTTLYYYVQLLTDHCIIAMTTPSIASFFPSSSSSSSPSKGKGEKRPFVSIGDDDDDDFDRPPVIGGRSISTSEPDYTWMTADGCLTGHIICRCNQLHQPVCVSGSRADSLV